MGFHSMTRRIKFALSTFLLTAALAVTVITTPSCSGKAQTETFPASPAVQARIAEQRAALASSGKYYLELRLAQHQFHFCHSGVSLSTWPVKDIELGTPMVFFFHRNPGIQWLNRTWPQGKLSPFRVINRVKIIPGDEKTKPTPDVAGALPPTLEELSPVPSVYQINFNDRLRLRICLDGQIPGAVQDRSRLSETWADLMEGLGVHTEGQVTLRLHLAALDGASLFRSFPESPDLLVSR